MVRHSQGAAWRRLDDALAPAAQHLEELLPTGPPRRLVRFSHLRTTIMNICLVTPAPPGSLKGNRVTAERWAVLLRELGHHVQIVVEYRDQDCDLLVALHAFKSHSSIRRFRDARPSDPLVVGLTGTDLYGDIHTRPDAVESLGLATRLVLLQPLGRAVLPATAQDKARVIYQSVQVPPRAEPIGADVFEVCVMGHLRPVKDPLRTALAARLLPAASRIQVLRSEERRVGKE